LQVVEVVVVNQIQEQVVEVQVVLDLTIQIPLLEVYQYQQVEYLSPLVVEVDPTVLAVHQIFLQ
jgi:hypothetical protein